MLRPNYDDARGSLRQYLYGIARNLVHQRQQANGREVIWDDEIADCTPAVQPSLDTVVSTELSVIVQAAISALPPLQREAIVLCELEELSLGEAAAVVGADVGTVKSRLLPGCLQLFHGHVLAVGKREHLGGHDPLQVAGRLYRPQIGSDGEDRQQIPFRSSFDFGFGKGSGTESLVKFVRCSRLTRMCSTLRSGIRLSTSTCKR
jgi:hypothetical protein